MLPGDGAVAWAGAARCSCPAAGLTAVLRTRRMPIHRKVRSHQLPMSVIISRNASSGRKRSAISSQCAVESGNTVSQLTAPPGSAESQNDIYGETAIFAATADPNSVSEWEVDFCSRPILDERGKKIWELVVCDSKRQLVFTKFYSNNVINSITLKEGLLFISETLGVPKPQKVRFFRSQMQTIISKACAGLDIQAIPSQRCITLIRLLQERYDQVYCKHSGFQAGSTPLLIPDLTFPLNIPENLQGERWSFVQLPLEGVMAEISSVKQGSMFGKVFSLDILGADLQSDAAIPGVAVASSRAKPLAAWTNGLELSSITVDTQRACLVLASGVSERWNYAYYRKSKESSEAAEAWETCKRACGGLHFLAVQQSLESEDCAGFWLLYDPPYSLV